MSHPAFSKLRSRLLFLVLLAVLPAGGLILYTGWEERRHAAAEAQENALRLARLAATEHQYLVEGAHQLLRALAQLPQVRGGEVPACKALFADLLRQYSRYANLGVSRPNGDLFCSALPLPGPVNIADRDYFRRALDTRAFAVGEYQIGRITGKAGLNFGYPVLDPTGQIQAVVFVALDLAWLNAFVARAELPPGSTLTVLDRTGVILARHPDSARWIGRAPLESSLPELIRARREGTAEALDLDGTPSLIAFAPLGRSPGPGEVFVSLGIPKEAATVEANWLLVRNLTWLGIIAASALVAAWVGGDLFVLRQVRALVSATRRLAAGDLRARTGAPEGPGELNELARAFDEMAQALEQRQAAERQAEAQLRRVNRALQVLSESNQALVRARSEADLLDEVCRILVESGGYRLAWVGTAEPDDAKRVRPVAQRGFDDGYLDTVHITWADTERGRGPTGTAIRTGIPSVVRNILADPHYGLWRAEAARRGYASSIALPLTAEGQTWGAFNIYAAEPDAFDPEEVNLLTELADDLVFGITSLRMRTERQRAEAIRQALYQASLEIQAPQPLADRLGRLLRTAQDLLHLDGILLFLAVREGQWLQPVAGLGTDGLLGTVEIPVGPEGGGIAKAYLTQEVVVWDGHAAVPEELRLKPPYDRIAAFRARIFANVPLIVHGRAIGVLGAHRKQSRRVFEPATLELLQVFAGHAAPAIEQARLYEELRLAAKQLEAKVEDRTRDLQGANQQLQEASSRKSEFLATMSHELRTPLNSIIGFAEILRGEAFGPLTEKQARYLTHIWNSGKHLLQLISDILDLSKVEGGKFVLQPEALSVPATLEDVLVIARGLANKKGQAVETELEPDLPPLRADPLRFNQILFNLLSNAVKFTPAPGRITLAVRRASEDENCLELRIRDTGVGIKAEDLPRLFQEFVQLETTQEKRHEGSGLGLALTKRLVELHGGQIWADSEGEGQGSTFTITLPLSGPPMPHQVSIGSNPSPN